MGQTWLLMMLFGVSYDMHLQINTITNKDTIPMYHSGHKRRIRIVIISIIMMNE
jgi:hypothetical protein